MLSALISTGLMTCLHVVLLAGPASTTDVSPQPLPGAAPKPDTPETPAATPDIATAPDTPVDPPDTTAAATTPPSTAGEPSEPEMATPTTAAPKTAAPKTAASGSPESDDEMSDDEMSDDEMEDMDMGEEGGHHAMAHPFYVHMGLPDGPGEANIRVFGIGRVGADGKVGPDGGFHIEAGLVPRLGIHIRNDAIWRTKMVEPSEAGAVDSGAAPTRTTPDSDSEEGGESSHTEVMAMLAILQNDAGTRGLSLFGQIAFPTIRSGDELAVTAAFGPSGRIMVKDRFVLDANFHVAASAKKFMGEYEAGAMVRVVKQLFIMVENRGEVAVGAFESSILPGVKYRFGSISVGLGAQVPITPDSLYRAQGMLQLDVGFM